MGSSQAQTPVFKMESRTPNKQGRERARVLVKMAEKMGSQERGGARKLKRGSCEAIENREVGEELKGRK